MVQNMVGLYNLSCLDAKHGTILLFVSYRALGRVIAHPQMIRSSLSSSYIYITQLHHLSMIVYIGLKTVNSTIWYINGDGREYIYTSGNARATRTCRYKSVCKGEMSSYVIDT